MTLRAPFVPAPCAEFPNDNPALHYGASWVCLAPLGATRAVVRPTPVRNAHKQDSQPIDHRAPPAVDHGPDTAEQAFLDAMKRRLLWPADIADVVAAWLLPPAAAPLSPPTRREEGLEALVARAMDARLRWSPELREVMELVIVAADSDESLGAAAPSAVLEQEEGDAPPASFTGTACGGCPEREAAAEVADTEPSELAAVADTEPSELAAEVADSGPSEASEGRGGTERPLAAEGRARDANSGPPDGFLAFVRALVDVALNSGATRAAAVIPMLFELGCIDASALDGETAESLQKRGVVDRRGAGFAVTEEFALTAAAWRDVLRGQSEDLAACGTSTLDTWAADLLRALRVAADDGRDVRRELRRRGVAAFGMLLAA